MKYSQKENKFCFFSRRLRHYTCLIFLFLCSCATYHAQAPVHDIDTYKVGNTLFCRIQNGDTLYAVAWRYELDYRTLIQLNQLAPPYALHAGQSLRLNGEMPSVPQTIYKTPLKSTLPPKTNEKKQAPFPNRITCWKWPARGKIIQSFSSRNKGINLSSVYQAPIYAAADGEVVYAGNGLKRYGHLVIIKHNDSYLSAYAFNDQLFVRENESVKAGQRIATMGKTPAGKIQLHFEIRKNGKPIDPLSLLQ